MHKVFAIVGMCGVGKSVISEYLEKKGMSKIYFGGVTMEKLKEAALEVTPENERMMREKLRRELGMGAYAKILLPRICECASKNDTVLDGLYSWEELKIIKEELNDNLIVIAIVVDKKIRYERLSKRHHRPLNQEEAQKRDITEIENIMKAGPIAYADYYVSSRGTFQDMYDRIDEILKEVSYEH